MTMVNVTYILRVVAVPLRMAPGVRLTQPNVSSSREEFGKSVSEPLTRMVSWVARLVSPGFFGTTYNWLEIGLGVITDRERCPDDMEELPTTVKLYTHCHGCATLKFVDGGNHGMYQRPGRNTGI